ncbi:MAG TPA: hypothetical protein DF383_00905 [Deltaproteobacteria bacterium]|nr:hypothetical protein [Deltaproteobacteria bacterium]
MDAGKVDQAEAAFKAILDGDNENSCLKKLDPDGHRSEYSDALHGLGMVYAKQGKYDEALDALYKAQKWESYNPEIKEDIKKVETQPRNSSAAPSRSAIDFLLAEKQDSVFV